MCRIHNYNTMYNHPKQPRFDPLLTVTRAEMEVKMALKDERDARIAAIDPELSDEARAAQELAIRNEYHDRLHPFLI